MVFQLLSGCTLALKWHWIGTRFVELLSIGNQVTSVVFQWLSGSKFAVKWQLIGTRFVVRFSIDNQETEWWSNGWVAFVVNGLSSGICSLSGIILTVQWRQLGSQVAWAWLGGTYKQSGSQVTLQWHLIDWRIFIIQVAAWWSSSGDGLVQICIGLVSPTFLLTEAKSQTSHWTLGR